MKHLQVTADVHEAVNILKQRYGVTQLHQAIEEFVKEKDPDLMAQAKSIVDIRLGVAPAAAPTDRKLRNTRNTKGNG